MSGSALCAFPPQPVDHPERILAEGSFESTGKLSAWMNSDLLIHSVLKLTFPQGQHSRVDS